MKASRSVELRWWIAAGLFFVAFAMVGIYIASRPPGRFDIAALALQGKGVFLAAFFTLLGRWYAVALISLAAFAFAFAARADVRLVAAVAASQLVSQGVVSGLKHVFHRVRPDHWFIFQEPDTSFPSGHSVTAVVFYLALALLLARVHTTQRPIVLVGVVALCICVFGLPWSRLALGAHYLSDVFGGLLFGVGWVCALTALAYRFGYAP
jgi:membrane-associated phospholipid phosphatase